MSESDIQQWFGYISEADKILKEQSLEPLSYEEKKNIALKLEECLCNAMKGEIKKSKVSELGSVLPNIFNEELSKIRKVDWKKYHKDHAKPMEII